MPPSVHPAARRRALALAAVATTVLIALRVLPGPRPAGAIVSHGAGFEATVLGWTSWYGSYGLDVIGTGWCIDHGLRAPDPDLGYVPTAVDDHSAATKAAAAWVVGAYGTTPDADLSAAIMLTLHDLMGAVYPQGPLDVDQLDPGRLRGFGGEEARVVDLARVMKADGIAHAHLAGPLQLLVDPIAAVLGSPTTVVTHLVDALGQPVQGIAVSVTAGGAGTGGGVAVTGADGSEAATVELGPGSSTVTASAEPPDPVLHAFASSTTPAQRAAVPARQPLVTTVPVEVTVPPPPIVEAPTTTVPPTTTTTTSTTLPPATTTSTTTSTTTTSTTTTSTTTTSTTTTQPPTTLAPTTTAAPAVAAVVTTLPEPTTTVAPTAPPAVVAPQVLARTGTDTDALLAIGGGLALTGAATVGAARRRAAEHPGGR